MRPTPLGLGVIFDWVLLLFFLLLLTSRYCDAYACTHPEFSHTYISGTKPLLWQGASLTRAAGDVYHECYVYLLFLFDVFLGARGSRFGRPDA